MTGPALSVRGASRVGVLHEQPTTESSRMSVTKVVLPYGFDGLLAVCKMYRPQPGALAAGDRNGASVAGLVRAAFGHAYQCGAARIEARRPSTRRHRAYLGVRWEGLGGFSISPRFRSPGFGEANIKHPGLVRIIANGTPGEPFSVSVASEALRAARRARVDGRRVESCRRRRATGRRVSI